MVEACPEPDEGESKPFTRQQFQYRVNGKRRFDFAQRDKKTS